MARLRRASAAVLAALALPLALVAPASASTHSNGSMFYNQATTGGGMFYNQAAAGGGMFYNQATTGGAMFYNQAPAVFRAASWALLSSSRWDADVLDCRTGSNYIYGRVLQSAGSYQVRVRAEWLSGNSSRDNRTYVTPRVVKAGAWLYFTLYGDQGGAKYPSGGCKITAVAVLR